MRLPSPDEGRAPSPELEETEGAGEPEEASPSVWQWVVRIARWGGGAVVFFGVVVALARWLRPELKATGQYFVETFGLFGMAIGTFIADGFHFPVPPQFYMLMAIAAETSPVSTLAAVTIGSLAGGTVGFFLARRLGRWRFFSRWLERSSKAVQRFGKRHGYRLVIAVSLTPIAFSVLCYLAGAYGLPKRFYIAIAVLRIPKLVLYYYLVRAGWGI